MDNGTFEDRLDSIAFGPWAPGIKAARPQVNAMLSRIFRSAKWPDSAEGSFWPRTSILGRIGTDPTPGGFPSSVPWLQAWQPGDIVGVY
jgi:hypothetical protein